MDGKKEELSTKVKEKVESFETILSKISEKARTGIPSETVKFVIKISGLEQLLKSGGEEDLERLENVMELVTLATKYDQLTPEEGIEKLLTDSALASDQDSLISSEEGVKLMTVHAAKGLEFDYCFITGLEENLFPHKKINETGIDSEEGEEERRLFYVAITRARKKIYLTNAQIRTIFGSKQINIPSEFLYDIDETLTEQEESVGTRRSGKILYKIDF